MVRAKDDVKLKLRTPEYLYTFKTTKEQADDIIEKAKDLEVIEVSRVSEKKSEDKDKESENKKGTEKKKSD